MGQEAGASLFLPQGQGSEVWRAGEGGFWAQVRSCSFHSAHTPVLSPVTSRGQAAVLSPRLPVLPLPGLHQTFKLPRTVLQDTLSPEFLTQPWCGPWWSSCALYARSPSFYSAHGLSSLPLEVSPQHGPEPISHVFARRGSSLRSHGTHRDPGPSKDGWTAT